MSQLSGWSCNSKILLPEEQVSGSYPPDHGHQIMASGKVLARSQELHR